MDDFGSDSSEGGKAYIWIVFVLATLLTQVVFFNMLIAIMGDSFERVMENREVNATKMKLNFMNDMAGTIGQTDSTEETDVFMYIIKPDEEDGGDGAGGPPCD